MRYKLICISFIFPFLCYLCYPEYRIDHESLLAYIKKVEESNRKLKIMSYNIRSSNLDQGLQKWDNRKLKMYDIIKKYAPDLISTQEGLKAQLKEISENFPEMGSFGFLKDDKQDYENIVIFYNQTKLKFIKGDYFWLSETPMIPYSKSWDAMFARLATYAVFEIKGSDQRILVINTHFDHKGSDARKNSAKCLLNTIKSQIAEEYESLPLLLMGDFNEAPFSHADKYFLEEGFSNILDKCPHIFKVYKSSFHYYYGKLVDNIFVRIGLFFGFTYHSRTLPRFDCYHIDWILTRKGRNTSLKPMVFHMPDDDISSDGIYASDHFPLFGIVELTKE